MTLSPAGRRVAPTVTRQLCEVVANRVVAPEHHVLTLACGLGAGFEPGQFVQLGLEPAYLPRPFSILRADGRHLAVLSKAVGVGTRALFACAPGQRVWVLGPLGRGFRSDSSASSILVGGGVGLPPIYALAERLSGQGPSPRVIVGARTADQVLLHEELAALGAEVHVMTDDGSAGGRGTAADRLRELLQGDGGRCQVYACGPEPMLAAVADLCRRSGTPCQVAVEEHMACGFGACQGCAVRTAAGGYDLVCRDGPAFDAERLAWPGPAEASA